MSQPVTLITGASEGIGAELARVFAAKGHEVVLVARRGELLTTLADEIAAAGGKTPITRSASSASSGPSSASAAPAVVLRSASMSR